MATITSFQSGLASDPATWVGGVVPVEGDKVIIEPWCDVILDGHYTWGDGASFGSTFGNSSINLGGKLIASRTVSSSLTIRGVMGLYQNSGLDPVIDFGNEQDPIPDGITFELILNKRDTAGDLRSISSNQSSANGSLTITMAGANIRERNCTLLETAEAGASSIRLSTSTHGWRPGDVVWLVPAHGSGTGLLTGFDFSDKMVIDAVAGDIITFTTPLTYRHIANSRACNFESNVKIRSFNSAWRSGMEFNVQFSDFNIRFDNVQFGSGLGWAANNTPIYMVGQIFPNQALILNKCTTLNNQSSFTWWLSSNLPLVQTNDCVFSSSVSGSGGVALVDEGSTFFDTVGEGGGPSRPKFVNNAWISNVPLGTGTGFNGFGKITNSIFSGCFLAVAASGLNSEFENCDCGFTYGYKIRFGGDHFVRLGGSQNQVCDITVDNCIIPDGITIFEGDNELANQSSIKWSFLNKQRSRITHQTFTRNAEAYRENSLFRNGSSSLAMRFYAQSLVLNRPESYTRQILCAAGQTVRIVGSVRMDSTFFNSGDCNLPTVSLSGLSQTTVSFTASSIPDVWQPFDISITNTTDNDGVFVLSFTASAKTIAGGVVYFDGVPIDPFVTKVRHYGFTFDEANPVRRVNVYTQATEAVASAYTGATIDALTRRVSFGPGTIDNLNKLYDYSQAWGVLNIAEEMPWTRAGNLLSLTDNWTVVQPTIGSVTWGGGTIEWNTPGTIIGSFDGNEFRFATEGTYDLSLSTFAGTIEFSNTSGGGVLVILIPENVDFINNNPGTITVQPVVQQATASINNIVPGSRVQVFNQTTNTEVVNLISSGSSWTFNYPEGSTFTAGDVVRVRLAYQSGATAKLPVQYRTIATSSGWSILAEQVDDVVYNTNGIDGDLVLEFIEDFPNVEIDIDDPDGVTTVQRGYAWYISGQMTEDGIRFFHGGMTAEDTVNYRVNVDIVDMKIQNINTAPILVSGGRLYRSDGATVIRPGGGGVQMDYGRAYTLETGVSGLTPEESQRLETIEAQSIQAARNAALAASINA